MRIISKHRDYYDIGLAHGVTDDLVYVRHPSEPADVVPPPVVSKILGKMPTYYYRDDLRVQNHVIGFCGKLYPVAELYTVYPHKEKRKMCFSGQDMLDFILSDKDLKKEYEPRFMKPRERWDNFTLNNQNRMFDEFMGFESNDILQTFFDMKAPVYVYRKADRRDERMRHHNGYELIVNPILKGYDFARMVDPYTAFQEVEMFVGGVLGMAGADTVEIGDEDMRNAKGFDDWSFKKEGKNSKKHAKRQNTRPKKGEPK